MVLHKGVQLGLDVFDDSLFLKFVMGDVNLVDALLHLVALMLELLDGFVVLFGSKADLMNGSSWVSVQSGSKYFSHFGTLMGTGSVSAKLVSAIS